MSTVSEKIAYLKGLNDGLELKDEKVEKLITGILDAFTAISDRLDDTDDFIDEIAETVDEMGDEIDEIDECLDELCDECECDCCCDDDDWDDECDCCCDDDDDNCLELECPYCHEQICFDSELFVSGEELRCPVCNKVVFEEE